MTTTLPPLADTLRSARRAPAAGPRPLAAIDASERPETFARIDARPLSPTIGAEIHGVDLRDPLGDATFAEIRRAFLAYKVIFFRDQALSTAQHSAFARRFGELEVHPFAPQKPGFPEVLVLEKGAEVGGYENVWHSDVTWRLEPSLGSVLRAIEVPPVGGDTLFCDMISAYEGLDPTLRERLDGLHAVHDFTRTFGRGLDAKALAEKQREFPPASHPVVRTHPETGRRGLYVNAAFTSHIDGMERAESDALLRLLYQQATIPEYQCRFRWAPDSIAFWDNRSTQHYASSDYFPARRVMERITIIGDRPH